MRTVSLEELMQAVDVMTENPYLYGDEIPEDMQYNGYEISFRKSCQLNQAVVSRPGASSGTLVCYSDRTPARIYVGDDVYTPRQYFIAYVSDSLKRPVLDSKVYGYVNGKPVYSHDEYAIEARHFGPFESDRDLLAYAEKETGHWSQAGWRRLFTDYYLSENDSLYSRLTVGEWKRLQELQNATKRVIKAAQNARGWRRVDVCCWADNSEEEIWEDMYGNRKTIMTVAPHGDLCY